jgi:hypothetical protein
VPLLQIAPSKTDAERLLVVSPDLADVLAAIITRLAGPAGKIPLTARYDEQPLAVRDGAAPGRVPRIGRRMGRF